MKTIMKLEELETIDHLDQFLNETQAVIFETVAVKKEGCVHVKCWQTPTELKYSGPHDLDNRLRYKT